MGTDTTSEDRSLNMKSKAGWRDGVWATCLTLATCVELQLWNGLDCWIIVRGYKEFRFCSRFYLFKLPLPECFMRNVMRKIQYVIFSPSKNLLSGWITKSFIGKIFKWKCMCKIIGDVCKSHTHWMRMS